MKGYQANSRLYWLVACHSLMICTGFGHIQVECDFGSVAECALIFFFSIKLFSKSSRLCQAPGPHPCLELAQWGCSEKGDFHTPLQLFFLVM